MGVDPAYQSQAPPPETNSVRVPSGRATAAFWYRKAAAQDYEEAKQKLKTLNV